MKINPQFATDRVREILPATLAAAAAGLELPLPKRTVSELFPMGKVIASAGVREKICPVCVGLALKSHAHGVWGRVSQWDALANDQAVKNGGRILSKFRGGAGIEFYVVTEADRSVTTVCLVEEF